MHKVAFLYAGQGSQHTGMGKDLYEEFPEFKHAFISADLSFDILEICFHNPNNFLSQTEYTQPCMVAFACGITDILYKKNIRPDYVCGLSLGEYSALYAAGVWDAKTTIETAAFRGKAMADASFGINAGMCAIIGLDEKKVQQCCDQALEWGVASICNYNSPDQIVIGGEKEAVDIAAKYAKEKGARRCVSLEVSGPFHICLMSTAGDRLQEYFKKLQFNTPRIPVLYNYLGGFNKDNIAIDKLLVNQVKNCIKMEKCIRMLFMNNVDRFVEIGPGNVIEGLISKTAKAMNIDKNQYSIVSLETAEDIENMVKGKLFDNERLGN